MPNEMDREYFYTQTHCFTCGGLFRERAFKYECRICGEWQCSLACLEKHDQTMESKYGS